MLIRSRLLGRIRAALRRSAAVALVGPRQVGKTTLARQVHAHAAGPRHWFDLEDPAAAAQLASPMLALAGLAGLVVIDEVQHAPQLFKVLRVLVDRPGNPARFLLLGSASPSLLRQSGESLAGRIEIIEAGGFTIEEAGSSQAELERLWWRGGFPRSYTAQDDGASRIWRREFIRTVVERDLPQLGLNVAAPALHRFWSMLAHWHGQIWSAADPARSLGVNESTVRRYLDWLTQAYLVRQLQPWFANIAKRQVKAPKVYLRDTGALHELLGIADPAALALHPKSGASWEGFALDQMLRVAEPDEAYFWATHAGAELDLLMLKDGRRIGVEFKRSDAPTLTPSMRIALHELELQALYVVYPGSRRYGLAERVEAVPLTALLG